MRLTVTSVVVALAGLFIYPAFADVVELKTGQRVEGTLKQATPASVAIEVGGQTITFEGGKVRAIYFGPAPGPAPERDTTGTDALQKLRAVQSVAAAGASYSEYSSRVLDAKIKLDQYLQRPDGDPALRRALERAAEYYVLAGAAWNATSTQNMTQINELARNPLFKECGKAGAESNIVRLIEAQLGRGAALRSALSSLWTCASDNLSEAEALSRR